MMILVYDCVEDHLASQRAFSGRFLGLVNNPGYHTSASTKAFLAAQSERITAEPLPSYSPDDHPIEYLWKKTKKRATHNKYFKEFAAMTVSVEKALAYFATHPDTVLGLFGRYCEESGLELKQAA